MKTFILHWTHGVPEYIQGTDIQDAYTRAGLGVGALKTLDYYEEVLSHADYQELKTLGIKRTIKLGKNEFGFEEKIIELSNGHQYDYIPEDGIYELRKNRYELTVE